MTRLHYACEGHLPNVTFQSVLISDGIHSFAIFNYNEIQHNFTQSCQPSESASAGYDAGDSKNYYLINSSCTNEIYNLADTSNVGVPGKYISRLDNSGISTPTSQITRISTITPNPTTRASNSTPDCIYISI